MSEGTAKMEIAPEKAGFDAGRLSRITEHLQRSYIEPGKIVGCQTLVSRHGHVAYFSSLGLMDRERKRPMRDDTVFRIYSMTKPITSVALMTLYEQGYFQLNDPVHRVIPEWRDQRVYVSGEGESMETKAPDQPMTFRHVLSHTGGLLVRRDAASGRPRVRQPGSDPRRAGETLANVRRAAGERAAAVRAGHALDVLVLDGRVRIPRRGDLREAVRRVPARGDLRAAGDARDVVPRRRPRRVERLAANYQRQPDKTLALIDDPERSTYLKEPTFFSGGGGLTSTTADYLRFCEMLRRGGELDGARILGSRTLRLMTQNHLRGDLSTMAMGAFSETAYEGVGFGLGFATTLGEVEAGTLGAGDFYWGGAASTIFWVDPREDLEVIFMTQLMPSATFNFRGQLKSIVYSAIAD